MSNADGFEELVSTIEDELNQTLMEKRGAAALMFARITGALYTEAITSGVPHVLAQEMAQDYWASEMRPTEVVVVEEGE